MRLTLLAAVFAAASLAHAQTYKCTDARGKITYSDKPCATGQKSQSVEAQSTAPSYASGNPDAVVGLWETVSLAHPRITAPGPRPTEAELKAMGEMAYMFGKPMKQLRCGASPLKEFISRWPLSMHCQSQISARGGTCTSEEQKSGAGGMLSETKRVTLTGNYRDHLNAKTRFIRVYASRPSEPDVDELDVTIRFLGECRQDMKPGEEYLVEDDGRLKRR